MSNKMREVLKDYEGWKKFIKKCAKISIVSFIIGFFVPILDFIGASLITKYIVIAFLVIIGAIFALKP